MSNEQKRHQEVHSESEGKDALLSCRSGERARTEPEGRGVHVSGQVRSPAGCRVGHPICTTARGLPTSRLFFEPQAHYSARMNGLRLFPKTRPVTQAGVYLFFSANFDRLWLQGGLRVLVTQLARSAL